jgi:hypothetical protein
VSLAARQKDGWSNAFYFSKKQHNVSWKLVAHNPSFAKKVGVSQSVGKDFSAADKDKKFGRGGSIDKQNTQHGSMDMPFKSSKKFGGMKPGDKVRRFQEGGIADYEGSYKGVKASDLGDKEQEWLKGVDRTDPFIMARFEDKFGARKAPVEERSVPAAAEKAAEARAEPTRTSNDLGWDGKISEEIKTAAAPAPKEATKPASKEAAAKSALKKPRGDGGQQDSYPTISIFDKKPAAKPYVSAQDAPGYLENAYPRKPAAKPKIDAEDDDFARKIKKNKADDEAAASNVVDRSVALASAIPFAGPAVRFGSKALKAFKAFRNSRGAMATRNAASKVKPNAGKPEDFNKLSQAERDRIAGRNRNVRDESGDRTGLGENENMKKGGKVGMKKPNPFMEMIAKKKAMAKDKKPEMKFAKGGMARGGMPMKDGKPAFMKKMNMGGMAKYAKGGGIESHGKTKGTIIRMASGGSVSSASRRADGIAQRGKTRC